MTFALPRNRLKSLTQGVGSVRTPGKGHLPEREPWGLEVMTPRTPETNALGRAVS
jgi:hypothetical protein